MSSVQPVPSDYPRVTPGICVDDAQAAMAFYAKVFGAVERMRLMTSDGRVGHAELEIGDGLVMVSDEFPDWGVVGPRTLGGTPVAINVYVQDCHAVHAAAVSAGATETEPVKDQFYGDRRGQFIDPWGHRWSVSTHIEDVSPEEMRERMAAEGL